MEIQSERITIEFRKLTHIDVRGYSLVLSDGKGDLSIELWCDDDWRELRDKITEVIGE